MKKRKSAGRIQKTCILFLIIVAGFIVWTISCEDEAHRMPAVEFINIEDILMKNTWTISDYATLSGQTGLSEIVLRQLHNDGRKSELLNLQEIYFNKVNISCMPNTMISCEEHLINEQGKRMRGMPILYVEDGDILITNCSHALGWRNGHAGIVLDASRGLVLEAQVLGSPAVVSSIRRWEYYPSFLILRLNNANKQKRSEIAAYAGKYMLGVPYRLTAGIREQIMKKEMDDSKSKKEPIPTGTQCAHLIWYVYKRFGYDLDSDGGIIVTPKDIADSSLLIMIQKYGI